ncbi:vitellogenin receptor, partial [Biomphalaria glabrata]
MFLSFWLLCALAQHSVTGLNVCQEADLHIIITVDCNYPPNHWDMIPNMLNMLDDRATGEPLTTMIDLSSWSNVTLNNSSVENVYKMCNNLNKSEEELSSTNILKLQELMKTNNTTKHLYINILQDSKYSSWASLIENIHFKSYNMLNIIISKTDQIQSFQTEKSIFIAKNDKLENNNLISYLLCQKCKKNWYPKMVNGIMKSCFLFERKEEPMNWSHAARYCAMKNSHLITFDNYLDYTLTQNITQKIIKKISKPKINKSPIIIFIGLHTLLSNNQLLWVNNRPVSYFIHDIVNYSYLIKDNCFQWRFNKSIDRSYILGSRCDVTKNLNSFCQQDLILKVENITMSELERSSSKSLTKCYTNITDFFLSKCSLDLQNPKFHCSRINIFISFHHVCDGVMDCSGGEDENVCTFDGNVLNKCMQDKQFVCSSPQTNGLQCLSRTSVCNNIHDCLDYSDEAHCSPCTEHSCSPTVCIPRHWVFSCDLVNSKDFLSFRSLDITNKSLEIRKKNENIVFCRKHNKTNKYEQIQTHTNTYNQNWAPRCIFLKSIYGNHLGCADLGHLSDCRLFVCPSGYTKCFNSYCLPDKYVNDGVEDCPYGEDEGYTSMFLKRNNYYKCFSSSIQLNPIYICDGTKDCPKGDDEHDCDYKCPA